MAGKTIIMSKLKQVVRLRANGVALQTIAKAVDLSRNTVKKYLRLIEVKQLNSAELLLMEHIALESLLQDPEPQDQARFESLCVLFPYFEKSFHARVLPAGCYGASTGSKTLVVTVTLSSVITLSIGRSAVQAPCILNTNPLINSLLILPARSYRLLIRRQEKSQK